MKARELSFEICGTETATINGQSIYDHNFLYWSKSVTHDYTHVAKQNWIDLVPLRNQFLSSSPNCPIRFWSLFEDDGVTPLVATAEMLILNNETLIEISSEVFNWGKTIYMKN